LKIGVGKVALVIDDDVDNRFFAEQLMQQLGFTVYGAASGAEALNLSADAPEIALAVVDYQLPDMSGLDLIQKLRRSSPSMFVIMATIHDEADLIDAAFDIGVNIFIVKPNGFVDLYHALKAPNSDILERDYPLLIDNRGARQYRKYVVRSG